MPFDMDSFFKRIVATEDNTEFVNFNDKDTNLALSTALPTTLKAVPEHRVAPTANVPSASPKNLAVQHGIDFSSAVISGATCAAFFHPLDQAVFLSMAHNRPLLSALNWQTPWHGILQSMGYRATVMGAYYYAQTQAKNHLVPYLRDDLHTHKIVQNAIIGVSAGFSYAMVANPGAAIRAHTWEDASRTFATSIRDMYRARGLSAFTRGTKASALRDITQGCTYEIGRPFLQKELQPTTLLTPKMTEFAANTTAAFVGNVLSAPFNFSRTVHHSTPPDQPLEPISSILNATWQEAKEHNNSMFGKFRFFQRRFNIGVGTTRGAVAMAGGQFAYDSIRKCLQDTLNEPTTTLSASTLNPNR